MARDKSLDLGAQCQVSGQLSPAAELSDKRCVLRVFPCEQGGDAAPVFKGCGGNWCQYMGAIRKPLNFLSPTK